MPLLAELLLFRNYFVEVSGKTGQIRNNQIDCLDKISDALGNSDSTLWSMKNGYVIARREGLDRVASLLEKQNKVAYQELKDKPVSYTHLTLPTKRIV